MSTSSVGVVLDFYIDDVPQYFTSPSISASHPKES
jgi:hypothetical protein